MTDLKLADLYWVLRSVNDHLVRAVNFTTDVELGIAHQQLNDEVLTVLEGVLGWFEPPSPPSPADIKDNLRRKLLGDKVRQEAMVEVLEGDGQ